MNRVKKGLGLTSKSNEPKQTDLLFQSLSQYKNKEKWYGCQ